MVVISKTILNNFIADYPDSAEAFLKWYQAVKDANWSNFNELRRDFGSADSVGNDRYVFNIKGNNFRLVALIIFKTRTLFILFIGTHQMYDKIEAKTVKFKN
ncbi:type II toxin-antitoxin system HigB family toxin [Pedobacter sp. BG31]|uniref:type II toxin-antitoxin system HigB family toxin n=1 Tax=Pedobacter sp. BG31 TaxID=3349697 RepID=UPI0035F30998